MDIGVWMSKSVLDHKREIDGARRQAWNVGLLPDNYGRDKGPNRLYVSVDGYWRGFFVLATDLLCNVNDRKRPYTLLFDPSTWTPIEPVPSVRRTRGSGYTLDVPRDFTGISAILLEPKAI